MGWRRQQFTKGSKPKKVFSGSKDWTREQKQQIEQYQEKYEQRPEDRRKAG